MREISGVCGDNTIFLEDQDGKVVRQHGEEKAYYTLSENGLLRIHGKGSVECIVTMDENFVPDERSIWEDAKYPVKEVIVEEGITELSMGALMNLPELISVSLPNSLRAIGEFCFAGCVNLEHMNCPDNLERVGFDAFEECYKLNKSHFPKETLRVIRI